MQHHVRSMYLKHLLQSTYLRHHVRSGDELVELQEATLNPVNEVLGADDVGTGCFRLLLLLSCKQIRSGKRRNLSNSRSSTLLRASRT